MDLLQTNITNDLSRLKKIIDKYSTYSIVGWCFSYNLFIGKTDREEVLHSPAKQLSFLIGVMLSIKEPDDPKELDNSKWEEILAILNKLFNHYWLLYMPEKENSINAEKPTEEWFQTREISLQAFFNYFDSGLLASIEQVKDRIMRYLLPFDEIIEQKIGISLTKSLEICDHIVKKMQNVLDEISVLKIEEQKIREELIRKHIGKEWAIEEMRRESFSGPYISIASKLFENLNKMGSVDAEDIKKKYGDLGKKYCELFIIERGQGPEIRYPTDRSIFEIKPIISDKKGKLLCPASNSLYLALNTLGEKIILESEEKSKYLQLRDKSLENEALSILQELVNKKATILTSVYETPDSHFEHDIIIDDELLTLIIEAKASPPIEPFRDPDKAFIRIRDAFKSDTGIQKAFDQTKTILKKLEKEGQINLYNKKGDKIYTLDYDSKKLQIGICVTRDNFGSLATDLSLLLEKEKDDKYPWALNILDLKNFKDAWLYLKKGEREFCQFLTERIKLHGKVYSADELEYAGYFFLHGDFSSFNTSEFDRIQLDPHYSDIFNDIYYAQYHGGPAANIKVKKTPVLTDLRKSIIEGKPVFIDAKKIKVGRNDKCPCGSGKKYKFCCGR